METKVIWKSLEYQSQEICVLKETNNCIEANSVITGSINNQEIMIAYRILANPVWETYFAEINVETAGNKRIILLKKENGNWLINDEVDPRLKNCVDIDISLTPFTNTLPIRRLVFKGHLKNRIDVVYIDIIGEVIKPVVQYYSQLSDLVYLYENKTSKFKTKLGTDTYGLVKEYPERFMRSL